MHLISFIALAAVIPAALSHPVPSDSLTTREAGNEVIEPRSVDISNVLQGRDSESQLRVFYLWHRTLANWFSPSLRRHGLSKEEANRIMLQEAAHRFDQWETQDPTKVHAALHPTNGGAMGQEDALIRKLWSMKVELTQLQLTQTNHRALDQVPKPDGV